MARPPLPRFATDVVITLNVAGFDEADALTRVLTLVDEAIRPAVVKAVRNHGSRTALVVEVQADPSGLGADSMARQ